MGVILPAANVGVHDPPPSEKKSPTGKPHTCCTLVLTGGAKRAKKLLD